MTTRNFRVHNGISVGDIVIDASANTITGGATAAPSADGQFSNKKYVDDSIAAISTTAINQGNSNVTVTDSGTGAITISADGTETFNSAAAATTITASGAINLTPGTDVVIPANKGITFGTGEKIEGDNTDLTVTSGGKINLTAATDVHIPNAVGLVFGDGGEHIETNNTDFTITSGGALNLTASTDVVVPANVGVTFGTGEKIEGDNTDLTVTSGAKINLTATSDVHIPKNIGLVFDDNGSEKIESNDTDLTVSSGGAINLSSGSTVAVTGALTVTGDLTVNGTTTTVATTNTTIADNIIELNSGISASSNDAGIIIERGSTGNNAAIMWDESADKFTMGTTTATAGDKSGGISVTAATLVANLEGNVTGNTSGSSGSCTGTAAIATAITVTDNESTNENNVILFAAGAAGSGNVGAEADGNMTYNPSTGKITATGFIGDLTGTATAAQYSDVAERFASDSAYTPGTVVALGGAEEITQVNEEASDEVFGVVSSLKQAAFKMNAGAGDDDTHPYIAMTGRVDVKVIGTVNKGDRLISASVPGYARAATKAECTAFNVIGRALTGKTEAGQGSVLAAVRVSH
mgnify:CR=1 FL=1